MTGGAWWGGGGKNYFKGGWGRWDTRGVGVTVSGDDEVIGEPDGETEGDDGVGCMGKVIFIYRYVPLNSWLFVFAPTSLST